MSVPKKIADKVELYEKLQSKADSLYEEIKAYFEQECDAEGFLIPFITDIPTGRRQNDGEFCEQMTLGEDWYKGKYYFPIDGSNKYIGYTYEI